MTERQKNIIKDRVVHKAVRAFSAVIPDIRRFDYLNCGSENFMPGSRGFFRKPPKNARWSLGFSKASVLPESVNSGDYYIAGYLNYPPNRAEGVIDDMVFRAIALSDSGSRGISVFCALDCVGLSNTDIRDIRERLRDFIVEKDIISINIGSTHCHSAIDTQGLWGDLKAALKKNPIASIKNKPEEYVTGKNPDFMEKLKAAAVSTIKDAVEAMKPGKLMYNISDASPFVRDKRAPDVVIKELGILRFEPSDGAAPTIVAILGAHATCLGQKNKLVSADFPFYFCSKIESNGGNAAFFQSAEAAVVTARAGFSPEGCDTMGSVMAYGEAIADYILAIPSSEFTELEPVFNIALSEVFIPVHNSIFLLLAKLHLVNNKIVYEKSDFNKRQDEFFLLTEIGYVTLGNKLKLALMPGEMMPELVCGGCADSTHAYTHTEWDLPSLSEIAGGELVCIGLCNDAIGYVVPDNDFGSIFSSNHYEEAISVGDNCATNLVNAFARLVVSSEKRCVNPDLLTESD